MQPVEAQVEAREPFPCVVPYLYVHRPGDRFHYPTSRTRLGAEQLAVRYLECVLVQVASLRLQDAPCAIRFVTNVSDASRLGRPARRLLDAIADLDVELVVAEYRHPPPGDVHRFYASRYVFDAIDAVAGRGDGDRAFWLTDVDCVWVDPGKVFAARPPGDRVGCLPLRYPPDYPFTGGVTLPDVQALAERIGPCADPLPWVGGELLAGSPDMLRSLMTACERLEAEVGELGHVVATEEQLLTLAGGLGRIAYDDQSHVAGRLSTGPRHHACNPAEPEALGLWHLPSEKGLSLRRAAHALAAGNIARLRRDLASPQRAARRFNVHGATWRGRLRDDGWLAANRLREKSLQLAGRA